MRYNQKIDMVIDTAIEQNRLTAQQKKKIEFAKSVFVDLLNKTDKMSVDEIKERGERGKIGWTKVNDEMMEVLLALRTTVDENPEIRKTRRRRNRDVAAILASHKDEMNALYKGLMSDKGVTIETKNGRLEAQVEMRVIYTENGKRRIRTVPAMFKNVTVIG